MKERIVFPPRILPDGGAPWGRTVETEVQETKTRQGSLEQRVNNEARNTSGQLAVLSRQIDELYTGRSSHTSSIPDFSYTHVATSGTTQGPSRTWSFTPPTGGTRTATLAFSYGVTNTNTTAGTNVWVELLQNGNTIWRSAAALWAGPGASMPSSWTGAAQYSFAYLTVPLTTSPAEVEIKFWFYDFTAATHPLTFHSLDARLTYQDMVQ